MVVTSEAYAIIHDYNIQFVLTFDNCRENRAKRVVEWQNRKVKKFPLDKFRQVLISLEYQTTREIPNR